MPKVKVNDIEMYYEVHGEGEPLVLLHGYFCSSQQWKHFIPEFQERFQLIIPDLRGHGRTTNPSEFTHRQAALDVYDLLDQLNLKEINGMGFSAGGMILLHMATQQPERIQSMILEGTTPYDTPRARECRAQYTMENIPFRQTHIYGEAQVRKLYEQFVGFSNTDSDDVNFTKSYLSTIQAKTLIIHGDRDKFFPVDVALYMYEAIPDSYLWVVPNAGHALVLGDHADDIKRVALDFFTKDWGTQ